MLGTYSSESENQCISCDPTLQVVITCDVKSRLSTPLLRHTNSARVALEKIMVHSVKVCNSETSYMTRASTIRGKRSLGSKGVSKDERWIRLHYAGMSNPYLGAHRYGRIALEALNQFQEMKTSDHTTQKP